MFLLLGMTFPPQEAASLCKRPERSLTILERVGAVLAVGSLAVTAGCSADAPTMAETQGTAVVETTPSLEAREVAGAWTIDFSTQPDGPVSRQQWVIETGTEIPGYNNEEQVYTDRPENIRIEDGALVIEARREDYGTGENMRHYTSGRITTRGIHDMQYGRLTVRAKLPTANGLWPAIWMLPTDQVHRQGIDPAAIDYARLYELNGEGDLAEVFGGVMDGQVESTVHTYNSLRQGIGGIARSYALSNIDNDFHDYTVHWSPEKIEFLIDGAAHHSYSNPHTDEKDWPFDQRFHLLLNMAVGGVPFQENGVAVDSTAFPARMVVQRINYNPSY